MYIIKIAAFMLVVSQFMIFMLPLALSDLGRPGRVSGQASVTPGEGGASLSPTGFIPNRGQLDERVLYYARIKEGAVFILKNGEIVYQLLRCDAEGITDGVVVRESITEMNCTDIKGMGDTGVKLNFFKGKREDGWQSALPCYTNVEYGEVLPGIRLSLSMRDGRCEKVFVVEPGARPEGIQLSVDGMDRLKVTEDGRLECSSSSASVYFSKPVAFQLIDGARKDVDVSYVSNEQQYGFVVGDYDSRYPLTIDPLLYSTYFGGSSDEECWQQIISKDGSIYIIGMTWSVDFPMVGDSYNPIFNGGDRDIFISRLDANLTTLNSSTYIGGSDSDYIVYRSGFVQGSDGNIYVAATTKSFDFPVTGGAYDESPNGQEDGVVFIMNSDLSELISSTYIGSSEVDDCGPLVLGPQGDLYVSGVTMGSDFPTTKGAYNSTYNYTMEIFISCFSQDLATLRASTFIGGNRYEHPRCLLLDESGDLFMVGVTASPTYPTTPGAYDETFNSVGSWPDFDVCISRLDSGLATLVSSTFVGGENRDECEDALFDEGTIVFVGFTDSQDYPTTPDAISGERIGATDVIVSRLNKELSSLQTSTYIGGVSADHGYAVSADNYGYVYIAGVTRANYPFPTTPGSFDPEVSGDFEDPFVLRIDSEFKRLTAATILGGDDQGAWQREKAYDIEVTNEGQVYVSGYTLCQDFPTTPGVIFEEPVGGFDCFISVLDQLLTLHSGKVIVAPGHGLENPPMVRVYPAAQDAVYGFEFSAYGPSRYGANVCCGNMDADTADEIITGAGPGEIYGPHVRGFEIEGDQLSGLNFLAYGTNKYGVNVAAGDIDADGFDEIITGAGPGPVFGPHVRGWNYDGSGAVTAIPGVSFFAYGTPKWGVNVAAGDIDGDGYDEIVTGAGPGAVYGPHVRGWNVDGGTAAAIPGVSFLAYGTNRMGVNVTCGDVDGDGIDEIVTGPGPSSYFGAHVRGWNVDGGPATAIANISFFAWPPDEVRFGAKIFAGADLDGDGWNEMVVGCADPNADTMVKVFQYDGSGVTLWFWLEAFPGLTGGTNVAAGRF